MTIFWKQCWQQWPLRGVRSNGKTSDSSNTDRSGSTKRAGKTSLWSITRPTQVAVIEAFNVSLGDRLGRIDSTLFLENRASLIDDFLTFHRKDHRLLETLFRMGC